MWYGRVYNDYKCIFEFMLCECKLQWIYHDSNYIARSGNFFYLRPCDYLRITFVHGSYPLCEIYSLKLLFITGIDEIQRRNSLL